MVKTEPSLSQIYYVILPLVRRAGQLLIARQKAFADLTPAERAVRAKAAAQEIETFMATTLGRLFPNHAVRGHDRTLEKDENGTNWEWSLMPLDGEQYYAQVLPMFAVGLALRRNGETVVAAIYEPAADTVFHGVAGEGSYQNGRPIRVAELKDLAGAMVYVVAEPALASVVHKTGAAMIDAGVPSLGLCYVAAGAVGGFVTRAKGFVDAYAAGAFIAVTAGAVATGGTYAVLAPQGVQKTLAQALNKKS